MAGVVLFDSLSHQVEQWCVIYWCKAQIGILVKYCHYGLQVTHDWQQYNCCLHLHWFLLDNLFSLGTNKQEFILVLLDMCLISSPYMTPYNMRRHNLKKNTQVWLWQKMKHKLTFLSYVHIKAHTHIYSIYIYIYMYICICIYYSKSKIQHK